MQRLYLYIIILLCTLPMSAQYYSVNFDKETVAAMIAAYNTEAATEAYYDEQIQKILKHYNAAEVATAGIFASKFLERKALTDLGLWSSSTENYYYHRIHNMVANKIIPKIWTVSKQMLSSPQAALYWGSYLMKICDETKSLCYQFESVVTNSTLSFSDIQFLEINQQIAQLLNLSEIGNVDWKTLLDDIANIPTTFTKDNLKADIDKLYQSGVSLATSGMTNIGDALLQQNSFHELFNGKVSKVIDIHENYSSLFESIDSNLGATLLSMIGGADNVAGLFQLSDYNLTSWMTDYLSEAEGTCYTQRWYIYRRDYGSETLCSYTPPSDDNSIINGSDWYRISTSNTSYYPDATEREAILQNSEAMAGWSRRQVSQLNAANDGNTYRFSSSLYAYSISKQKTQVKKAYAYNIIVTKSWDNKEVVYEDVFDSFRMDLTTFKAQLEARLSEYNDNEDGYYYYIGSDARNYYQTTDAEKLQGIETVTISVTCSDGVTLAEGTTQYKCSSCGSSLNDHSKACAMETSVSESSLDLSGLETQLSEAENQVSSLQTQISTLESQNAQLLKDIASASVDDAATYRQQYNSNKDQIESLTTELTKWKQTFSDLENAKAEAATDDDVETDDYYRIPAIMSDCKTAYNLSWQSEGSWSGYTYTRTATMPNINGVVTFNATLSIARKPKYALGIKIHRAIMQITWKLTSEYTDTHVEDVLTLEPDMSDEEKVALVNDRISEIAEQYPSCKITTEYASTNTPAEDTSSDVLHLLWTSDRLEVAREIDTRITKIYADLVSLEKMMHYKRSIIDVFMDIAPELDSNQGRRQTLLEECHSRWMKNAALRKEDADD